MGDVLVLGCVGTVRAGSWFGRSHEFAHTMDVGRVPGEGGSEGVPGGCTASLSFDR
jgi:hypothetical protein